MSKKPRRKFETGFKKQLVAQIESGQITAVEAARTHRISPTVICYWRKQFQTGELSEGPTRGKKLL
ncbi:MAG: transposase [Bdellovibrionales bacterium]|nr:transposase [Bdellovibrionales bacterium]